MCRSPTINQAPGPLHARAAPVSHMGMLAQPLPLGAQASGLALEILQPGSGVQLQVAPFAPHRASWGAGKGLAGQPPPAWGRGLRERPAVPGSLAPEHVLLQLRRGLTPQPYQPLLCLDWGPRVAVMDSSLDRRPLLKLRGISWPQGLNQTTSQAPSSAFWASVSLCSHRAGCGILEMPQLCQGRAPRRSGLSLPSAHGGLGSRAFLTCPQLLTLQAIPQPRPLAIPRAASRPPAPALGSLGDASASLGASMPALVLSLCPGTGPRLPFSLLGRQL